MTVDWRKACVPPTTPIRDAMGALDGARTGILLVTEDDGRLLGTVTDGDIRRAILRSVPLDGPVHEVMCRSFKSLPSGASRDRALTIMTEHGVRQLPAVDAAGRVKGLYLMDAMATGARLPNWVVIMAGGQGRRLMPLTQDVPKPMLPIGGQPLLEIMVERLVRQGFHRLFISVNYLADRIKRHFGDGSAYGCSIEYLEEEKPLGTAGSLTLLPERPTSPVVVTMADLLTDVNVEALLSYHTEHKLHATLAVRPYEYQVPYGVVRVDGHNVVNMEEKPVRREFINAGIYALEPPLLDLIPRGSPFSVPDLLHAARKERLSIGAFPVRESWIDIGLPETYERVRATPGAGDDK